MLYSLMGVPGYAAGASGTVSVPGGACVLLIVAHASAGGAGFTLFGGQSVPIINAAPPATFAFPHLLYQSNSVNGGTVIFTGTDSYAIFWVREGHAT